MNNQYTIFFIFTFINLILSSDAFSSSKSTITNDRVCIKFHDNELALDHACSCRKNNSCVKPPGVEEMLVPAIESLRKYGMDDHDIKNLGNVINVTNNLILGKEITNEDLYSQGSRDLSDKLSKITASLQSKMMKNGEQEIMQKKFVEHAENSKQQMLKKFNLSSIAQLTDEDIGVAQKTVDELMEKITGQKSIPMQRMAESSTRTNPEAHSSNLVSSLKSELESKSETNSAQSIEAEIQPLHAERKAFYKINSMIHSQNDDLWKIIEGVYVKKFFKEFPEVLEVPKSLKE